MHFLNTSYNTVSSLHRSEVLGFYLYWTKLYPVTVCFVFYGVLSMGVLLTLGRIDQRVQNIESMFPKKHYSGSQMPLSELQQPCCYREHLYSRYSTYVEAIKRSLDYFYSLDQNGGKRDST